MLSLSAKAPKHTNASAFGIYFHIFFLDVTCLEVLLPSPLPPQNTYNTMLSNKKVEMGGSFGSIHHHETFEVHEIVRPH
jgi:hypothetical protein